MKRKINIIKNCEYKDDVNEMLLMGISSKKIVEFLKNKGIEIAPSTITLYKRTYFTNENILKNKTKYLSRKVGHINLSYLAGFIDGEGSITLHKSKSSTFHPNVSVGNTNFKVVEWIKEVLGMGNITYYQKTPPKKSFALYSIRGSNAEVLLRAIYPYLIVKKPQAESIIKAKKYDQLIKSKISKLNNL